MGKNPLKREGLRERVPEVHVNPFNEGGRI
jgi:hypothetical protein